MALSRLPPAILGDVLSYLTHDSKRLAWFGTLDRSMHAALVEEPMWRHLCLKYWYATDERLKEWPNLSPHSLYRALEQWAPLEGFYVFTPAFPWGLLVLVRIAEGQVHADVIRFVPQDHGSFVEVPIRLFSVGLTQETGGIVRSLLIGPCFGTATNDLEMVQLDPEQLIACTRERQLFTHETVSSLFPTRHVLRITAARSMEAATQVQELERIRTQFTVGLDGQDEGDEAEEELGEEDEEEDDMSDTREDENVFCSGWEPGSGPARHASAAAEKTKEMLESMLRSNPCDLALIRSPADFAPPNRDFPGIRPGLYVGDYGHSAYGQYRTEVLLLEYKVLANREALLAEATRPSEIFARPGGQPAPENLRVLSDVDGPITFMRGVKQCGDMHVPMGATTFVAVCGPPEACLALAEGHEPPQTLLNRQTGRMETVVCSWRGFGTLAMPSFRHPSWSPGWLVQFGDDGGGHRFGFAWDRNQDAVVLVWIIAQDACPFLQRAWLPQDLQ